MVFLLIAKDYLSLPVLVWHSVLHYKYALTAITVPDILREQGFSWSLCIWLLFENQRCLLADSEKSELKQISWEKNTHTKKSCVWIQRQWSWFLTFNESPSAHHMHLCDGSSAWTRYSIRIPGRFVLIIFLSSHCHIFSLFVSSYL